MHVLLASSSSGSRGSGELYLVYLGRALKRRGHTVTLWTSAHPRMDELANTFSSFADVLRSRYRNTYDAKGRSLTAQFNFRGSVRIAREWRESGADIVHVNKQNLEDGLDLLRAARYARQPCLCTLHFAKTARFLGTAFPGLRDRLAYRALTKFPGMLVTVLPSHRRDLLRFLGATPKVRLVPCGVPAVDLAQRVPLREAQRATLGITSQQMLFLGIGRAKAHHQARQFLEVAQRIHHARPKARFVWISEGEGGSDWTAEVSARGLAEVVQRLPWQLDRWPTLFAADCFLEVAEDRGLPVPLLEALSAGVPCAFTPARLAEMPMFDSSNALLIDEESRWLEALETPGRRQHLAEAARHTALREFSLEQMAEQYETLYAVAQRSRH